MDPEPIPKSTGCKAGLRFGCNVSILQCAVHTLIHTTGQFRIVNHLPECFYRKYKKSAKLRGNKHKLLQELKLIFVGNKQCITSCLNLSGKKSRLTSKLLEKSTVLAALKEFP